MFTKIINFIAANWTWFKSFFSEESGPSTTRALNWIWMTCLVGNITFVVAYNTIQNHKAELPPMEAASGYVAITALLLSAKVGQRIWGENPVTGTPSGSLLPEIVAQYSSSYMTGSVIPTPTPTPIMPQPYVPVPVPVTSSVPIVQPDPLPQPTVLPTVDPNNP